MLDSDTDIGTEFKIRIVKKNHDTSALWYRVVILNRTMKDRVHVFT